MPQNIVEVTGTDNLQTEINNAGPNDVLMVSDTHVGDFTITDKQINLWGRENSRIQGKLALVGTCVSCHLVNLDFQLNGTPASAVEPAISMQRAIDCSVRGCRIRGHGYTSGIEFDRLFSAERCWLVSNDIDSLDNFGLVVYGDNHLIAANQIGNLAKSVVNTLDVAGILLWGTGHRVLRNYVHDLIAASSIGTAPTPAAIESFTSLQADAVTPWPLSSVAIEWNTLQRIDEQCLRIDNDTAARWASGIDFRYNVAETLLATEVVNGAGTLGLDVSNNYLIHRGAGGLAAVNVGPGTGGPSGANPSVDGNRYFHEAAGAVLTDFDVTTTGATVGTSNATLDIATFDPSQYVNPRWVGVGNPDPTLYQLATVDP